MGTGFPIQGFRSQKLKRLVAIGGEWDEFSAQANNDTNSVTLSSNGTAKSYNVWIPYPAQSSNPLINYLVLVIQVSGYISLASGASSGSASVSIILNGNTLYSTTISNTNNEMIINQVIPYSQFPSYNQNGGNTLEIQVQLGSGAASVTISQVQYMFGILLDGGSNGLSIQISISQSITYINDDPSIIQYSNFGLGTWIYIFDPFGITTGVAQINIENGTVVINTNGNNLYMANAFPINVSGNNATANISISVSANNSLLIGYYVIAIAVGGVSIKKGYAHQIMYFRAQWFDDGAALWFSIGPYLLPENAIWWNNWAYNNLNLLNATLQCCSGPLSGFNYYWGWSWGFQNLNYLTSLGSAKIYILSYQIPQFVLEFDHIAENYSDSGNMVWTFSASSKLGFIVARFIYVEVPE
jgi:hypothetical protein